MGGVVSVTEWFSDLHANNVKDLEWRSTWKFVETVTRRSTNVDIELFIRSRTDLRRNEPLQNDIGTIDKVSNTACGLISILVLIMSLIRFIRVVKGPTVADLIINHTFWHSSTGVLSVLVS